MAASHKRRIVRRVVMAVVAIALVVASYLSSVALLFCARTAGWVPSVTASRPAELYIYPVLWYATEGGEYPGSHLCWELLLWSQQTGEQLADK